MKTKRKIRREPKLDLATLLFLVVPATVIATFVAVILTGSFANATYSPAKSVITLSGVGSAPSCPSGWTEIVGQTAAGTFSPITSISTTGISPITSISTVGNFEFLNAGSNKVWCAGGNNQDCTEAGTVALASGGSATGYTVANGGSATTYTHYYRVCER
jgi:hypothetical protein